MAEQPRRRLAENLVTVAVAAAEAGGRAVLNCLAGGALDVETKTVGLDLVTNADIAAQQAILATIIGSRPDDGFVGEEGGNRDTTSGITWVVDPIDSTANLVRGLPMWSVSVAARTADRTLAGCVASPALREVFSGGAGLGVRLNGSRVKPGVPAKSLGTALGLIGWPSGQRNLRRGEILDQLIGMTGRLRSPGSPALGLAWTAAGRADFAYYEQGFYEWDIDAGLALCAEAGLTMRLKWSDRGPHRLLVAQAHVFDELDRAIFG